MADVTETVRTCTKTLALDLCDVALRLPAAGVVAYNPLAYAWLLTSGT